MVFVIKNISKGITEYSRRLSKSDPFMFLNIELVFFWIPCEPNIHML